MKKSKIALLAGVAAASALFLAACGSSSNASNTSTYNYVFSSDPDTLDYLSSNRATTSDLTTNFIDGLFENDQYDNLKPALAEDWSVSKDGLTYTYKLRKDAKWYDYEGNEYANVTAHDFVTGLKYVADQKSDALYLVQNSVAGLDDYVNGKTTDFSKVGIKAVDDYTLEYTLTKPETYWNSKLTTATLMPVNEQFLKSAGKDFGSVKPSGLLYNGPFILKSFTSKSSIEMEKNENYYDKDNVKINNVKLTYFDGSDQDYLARTFSDGSLSSARLFPTSSTYSTIEKQFKDNIIYGAQDATSYYVAFNVNRQSYNHTTKKTDAQKNDTKAALQNKDFRQALYFAWDRTAYAAQSNGKDGANKILRSLIVPPTFVQVDGKDFGTVVEEKLATTDEWKGVSFADAQDSIYNADKAKAEFAKAKATLESEGVTFPIQVDYLVDQTNKIQVQQADSMKDSIESALGKDNVVINVHKLDADAKDNATYFAQAPEQKDFDIEITGWGPDFQDPSTYLDLANPTDGALLENMGLNPSKDADKAIMEKIGLNDYDALLKDAAAETSDLNTRYEKYATAQAWLTDNAIVLPVQSLGGTPQLSKTKPYSGGYSLIGIKGDGNFYKYRELQSEAVTSKEFEAARKKWLEEKEASNKKYNEDLAKHVN